MLDIWQAAVDQFSQGRDFILAVILSVRGSSPRHVGTRFLVRDDWSTVSTIGGGLFESEVQRLAMAALKDHVARRAVFSFSGDDCQSKDMICGGEVEVLVECVQASNRAMTSLFERLLALSQRGAPALLFSRLAAVIGSMTAVTVEHVLVEPDGSRTGDFPGVGQVLQTVPEARLLKPAQFLDFPDRADQIFLEYLHPAGTLYVFGGGHVGACVAHLAAYVDFRVIVIDDREEFLARERFPEADRLVTVDSFDEAFSGLAIDSNSFVVIVTRGHSHDRTVLAQALRTDAGYIGMIGSRRKNAIIFQSLLMDGFTREDLERVHAPIGLPIGGETPQEIAVSIVAEMIQNRSRSAELKRSEGGWPGPSGGCGTYGVS
jgi:xanthine dehydrogenase accessory factor